jgi:hypothetical protein
MWPPSNPVPTWDLVLSHPITQEAHMDLSMFLLQQAVQIMLAALTAFAMAASAVLGARLALKGFSMKSIK